jgi:uncharacterized membrane protein YvbJ
MLIKIIKMNRINLLKIMKVKIAPCSLFILFLIVSFLITGCNPNKKNNKTISNIKSDSAQILLTNSADEYKLAENEINKLAGISKKMNKFSEKMMLELVEKKNSLDRLITTDSQDTLITNKMKELADYRVHCTKVVDSILLINKK